MSKVFIDANVIANWILISSSANRLEELKDDKILSERFRAFSYSSVNSDPHDAILLTTAVLNECKWFITNDSEIIQLNKRKPKGKKRRKGKPPLSELFNITPDSPQNFLREVKREIGKET